ncbi:MAG: hypothetical protein IJN20_08015 [Oscillospiraceae bacterium]|nr:hypothetical protein [Oscillospiraceae bacterium]
MKNKKMWFGLAALAVLIVAMMGIYFAAQPEITEGAKTFTVTVVHKDGTEKEFTYHTAETYLGAVLLAEGLIAGEDGAYGLMISAVDGETADWSVDQGYWALYIGEEYATTGVDNTPVTDGGEYRMVYTIG